MSVFDKLLHFALLLQVSFEFDELSGTEVYEIVIQSPDNFISLNQTNTTYYTANLIPGLQYNITITAFGNGRKSESIEQTFATGNCFCSKCC